MRSSISQKIKFRDLGIRVVYKVERVGKVMKIIVVSARTDEQVKEKENQENIMNQRLFNWEINYQMD